MYKRPGLLGFLERLHEHFELILFSNGSQIYTETVVTKLLETLAIEEEDKYC
jgi:TFIIF-interacting CTD phosphatase-like protein